MTKPSASRGLYLTLGSNPYTPPTEPCEVASACNFDRRFLFLLLPPLIPLAVHSVIRMFIPANESLYHGMFTLGALATSLIWAQTMIDRFRLSLWKSYLITCVVWGAVLASGLFASTVVGYATGGS